MMIFDQHANLKYKFGNRHFWAEGYSISTVGLNETTIKKYDRALDKLSVRKYEASFKGGYDFFSLQIFSLIGTVQLES